MTAFRLGLIGCGGMGACHAEGFAQLANRVRGTRLGYSFQAHFLDCIETGTRPLTDGPGSLQGLRLIWRLYEAEEHGVVADLKGLGLDEYQA